ncbi:Putative beta-lactamase-inhibitor-like, PepSY-like [Salegentibacter echinorum]|uniref:Putative beta-lactamase-inhibitor-like, PepSY-like n=1 Tax=Salegentibacter echinorum TaxID=1073325 RepID=A0A1M5K2N3_SALEC|nr:PepSY-like domain-containing protein [Salegentibacter echinorum]SHG47058.1 Putative beta-lactamase-inhibitor-like, PepSY-like [Salegentibacter echinorum]
MKKVILILGMVFMATTTFACVNMAQDKVPKAVKKAFANKFPTAKKVHWDKESDKEWEAEFRMKKMKYSANFLTDGTWQETEHEIDKKDIPQAVSNTLKKSFSRYDVEESEISETKDGMVYEFEIEKGEETLEVAISSSGKVVKKETSEEDEDND